MEHDKHTSEIVLFEIQNNTSDIIASEQVSVAQNNIQQCWIKGTPNIYSVLVLSW